MGNEFSNPASKLGITALAATTPNIEKNEIDGLLNACKKLTLAKEKPDKINKEDFSAALKQFPKLGPADVELFMQLFVLYDEEGHEEIDYTSFFIGMAACLQTNTVSERLKWSFSLYDINQTGYSQRGDVKKVLLAINKTAAYLGDPVIAPNDIDNISMEIFQELIAIKNKGIKQEEIIAYLLKHPLVLKFVNAEGVIRFGSTELLAA